MIKIMHWPIEIWTSGTVSDFGHRTRLPRGILAIQAGDRKIPTANVNFSLTLSNLLLHF